MLVFSGDKPLNHCMTNHFLTLMQIYPSTLKCSIIEDNTFEIEQEVRLR